ncbi:DUF4936 family protein [Aquabacterium soli]|nr:DUF4936 family protein [Aquabacterium soli]
MSALYIYYRVQPGCEQVLAAAIHQMQARLRGAMPGLAASLQQRTDLATGQPSRTPQPTWMETYHFNGHADHRAWAAFEAALERELPTLPVGIEGPRQTECFSPLAAVAGVLPTRKE